MKPEIMLPEAVNPRVPAPAQPFRTLLPIQIRFNDIDLLGHVNNEMYFAYMDIAKARYFQEVMGAGPDWRAIGMVVASINCDFYSPTTLDEQIVVATAVTAVGEKSLQLEQRVVNAASGDVKCIGRTVMVAVDPATGRSTAIAPEWVRAVSEYEGRRF